ncbi:Alpha/Beta hydrolase protein [Dactylonectria macrodidyma]|uniref:Carboxypeptidase n=1 Tax=Dactylonectria macrodidyma TaxID=307937 RepID=A0A9P9FUZ6_9HYPO|nr:Alpha/Beta hydrolase protein [Dactylonectria macrodidyma]
MALTKLVLSGLLGLAAAQFPPKPESVTTVKSKLHENVTISFKEPGLCETTPGVKSYSGYVHLPAGFLNDEHGDAQDYPINTFFWFFESRKDPHNAPLAIWLNGGPGGSSIMGLLDENGPCFVEADSKSTRLNPWSWNNEVNMLYLDQPTQVGFSYDIPTNCTVRLSSDGAGFTTTPTNFDETPLHLNLTTRAGTFGSQKIDQTANTTAQAAHVLWHFAQTWFTEFPHYKPNDDKISVWAESYGGHYGPGFVQFFQQQNEKITNGTIDDDDAHYLHLDTLGIVNGWLDMVVQGEAYISFPYNNTYGIEVFNKSTYDQLMDDWNRPNGCKDQTQACRDKLKGLDPSFIRKNFNEISDACEAAEWCGSYPIMIYNNLSQAWLDIGHPSKDPFPPPHHHGWLTQESVLAALGVPVNYTWYSTAVSQSFDMTHDLILGGFLEATAYLLDSGIKVHMMYGDRDYACNWVGGEAASLAIPYSQAKHFANAGYAPLLTDDGESGRTRQFGNFSFTRVYQAGHEVPSYQPAAAYDIFMRATFNRDIATGLESVTDELSTTGPKDTWHIKNTPPDFPKSRCYILRPDMCLPEVWAKVESGEAVIKDFYVVEDEEVVDDSQLGDSELEIGEL